jgi:hypothetical protein
MTLAAPIDSILRGFGVHRDHYQCGDSHRAVSADGETFAHVSDADADSVTGTIEHSKMAFLAWAIGPCPRQGELVRIFGQRVAGLIPAETGTALECNPTAFMRAPHF